ncbi:MAG: tetratricopeptide repeat protein [Elusimicrobiota bacterium]
MKRPFSTACARGNSPPYGGVVALALMFTASLTAAAASTPDSKAKRGLAAAIRLYHRLDLAEAAARFDETIEGVPGWKTAAGYRAACRWTLGDTAGAVEDAKVAVKIKPNDASSYAARGKARLVLGNYDGALSDFRASSKADNRSVEGPLGEGGVLSAMGKPREARAALDRAVERDPGSAAALLMRAAAKDRQRDYRGAVEDYGSILEINPKFAWARFYRAKDLRELKDYRGADVDFCAFIEMNDEHEDAHYLRSNVRFLLGDYRGAIADLTRVIELNPRKGLAYSNRGQTRALLGDKAGAVADLRKAFELDVQRRDKISTAIAALESDAAPVPEPAQKSEASVSQTAAPRRVRSEDRDAPSFGDDGPGVSIEKSGKDMAPKRVKAPEADLDDELPTKPQKAEPGPDRRERKGTPMERHNGEEESLFIDK